MKKVYIIIAFLGLVSACSTPGAITARPDPNVSTSGTLGSVKATNGPPPERQPIQRVRDSVERLPDRSHH